MHLLNIPIEIESPRVKEKYEISYKNDFVIHTFNKLIIDTILYFIFKKFIFKKFAKIVLTVINNS